MKKNRLFFYLLLVLVLFYAINALGAQSAEDYFVSAMEHQEAGNQKEALKDFNKAVKLNPKLYYAYYYRGTLKSDRGEWQEAIADFNASIKLYRNFVDAYYARGIAKMGNHDYQGAIADFTTIIKIRKYSADGYFARGIAFALLKETESACADLQMAQKLGSLKAQSAIKRYCVYIQTPSANSANSTDANKAIISTASSP